MRALLRNVRPWGGVETDLFIEDGVFVGGEEWRAGEGGHAVIEGGGRIALPAFSDSHAHIDSTRLGLPFRSHTGDVDLYSQIETDRTSWRHEPVSMLERCAYSLARTIAHGATNVRTFAQVDADCGLERLEAVLHARERYVSVADVEVIAFPQFGLLREPGVVALMADALAAGADVVGGIDPCVIDRDPVEHLDTVFALAERFHAPIDIHLHEPGPLGIFSIELICERVIAHSMQSKVTISHATALSDCPPSALAGVLEKLAQSDVGVVTTAAAGRPVIPLRQLSQAGVRVGLGQDGLRDYWSPYGDADMLARAWQLAFVNGYVKDDDIEFCAAAATLGLRGAPPEVGARDGQQPQQGLAAGDDASFVLIPGETVSSIVMDKPSHRDVYRGARLVASNLQLVGSPTDSGRVET